MIDLIVAKAVADEDGYGEFETAPLRGRLLRLRVSCTGSDDDGFIYTLFIDGGVVVYGLEYSFDVMPVVPVYLMPVFGEPANAGQDELYMTAPVYWGPVKVENNGSTPYSTWEIMAIIER